MTRSEKARDLFLKGYNCSQAVLGAFDDVLNMDFDTVMRLGSSFGGGVARLRQICGTCSAMFMIAGLTSGYTTSDASAKSAHYAFIQGMAKEFEAENGSIVCKELLSLRAKKSEAVDNGTAPNANVRTDDYYRTRPCLALVESAVAQVCRTLHIDNEMNE